MHKTLQEQLSGLSEQIIGFLPSLLAGIALVLLGWVLGWVCKRVIIQLAYILRLDRFLVRSRWRDDFAKGDVRFGLYNFLGNIAFFIIFIIFLDNAFHVWQLTVFYNLLETGIYFIPKAVAGLAIFGIGWLIASSAERAVRRGLHRESIPRAPLLSRFVKAVLLLLFSAMALVELDIARQVVLIGFATIFITLGILTVVLAAIGGKDFVQKVQQSLEDD
ncbi:MAG TPA: hypothetical protein VJ983_00110 [candidate division Zixibacteria bacterium]|nr:hypothetical protein [candidate division Zixibacteria bacterium]